MWKRDTEECKAASGRAAHEIWWLPRHHLSAVNKNGKAGCCCVVRSRPPTTTYQGFQQGSGTPLQASSLTETATAQPRSSSDFADSLTGRIRSGGWPVIEISHDLNYRLAGRLLSGPHRSRARYLRQIPRQASKLLEAQTARSGTVPTANRHWSSCGELSSSRDRPPTSDDQHSSTSKRPRNPCHH